MAMVSLPYEIKLIASYMYSTGPQKTKLLPLNVLIK